MYNNTTTPSISKLYNINIISTLIIVSLTSFVLIYCIFCCIINKCYKCDDDNDNDNDYDNIFLDEYDEYDPAYDPLF